MAAYLSGSGNDLIDFVWVRYSRDRLAALVGFLGGVLTEKDAWEVALISSLSRITSICGMQSSTEVDSFRSSQHMSNGDLNSSRNRQPFVHIEFKGAIRVDVRIDQGDSALKSSAVIRPIDAGSARIS